MDIAKETAEIFIPSIKPLLRVYIPAAADKEKRNDFHLECS